MFGKHHIFVTPIVHEEFQGLRITPNVYTTLSELDPAAAGPDGTDRRQGPAGVGPLPGAYLSSSLISHRMKNADNAGPATINLKPAIYVGAAISALFLLLPYVNRLVIPAYLLGPLAATWFMIRRRAKPLDYKQGAQLGFYSAFYGAIAAMCIDTVAAHFLREQLWRFQNLYRIPPLLAGKGLESDNPVGWYLLMAELTVIAIVAAVFGVPSGLLGVKLFRSR